MPKRNPHDDDAVFCVSLSTYYSSRTEAEFQFDKLKDLATGADKSVEFHEWDEVSESWSETNGYVDPRKEEAQ